MVTTGERMGRRSILLSWIVLLLLACTPAPTRRPQNPADPHALLRTRIQRLLETERNPQARCRLRLQEAVVDLLDGRNAADLAPRTRPDCTENRSAILESIAAMLEGDPWLAAEKALHFLEATEGDDAPLVIWLRRLAALPLMDADFPEEAFIARLERVLAADPTLPALAMANGLDGRLVSPGRRETGAGLAFRITQRVPVPGRFAFASGATGLPSPEKKLEEWQDGQPLSSSSLHPERVTLEIDASCPRPEPLLLELAPGGPAIVQTSDGFRADSVQTPGVESRTWRLVVPGITGQRTLFLHLAALADPRFPRIRLLSSASCSFAIPPVPRIRIQPPPPEPEDLAKLVEAAESARMGSVAAARRILESWRSGKNRPALVDFLHARALLADESLPPEAARRLARRILDAAPQAGWVLREKAALELEDGHPERAHSLLSRLKSPWAATIRAQITSSGQDGTETLADLLFAARHYQVFTTMAAAVFDNDPALAISRLRTASALRPDRIDLMQGFLRLHLHADAVAEGRRVMQSRGAIDAPLAAAMMQACRGAGNFACAEEWARRRLSLEPSSETAFLQWLDAWHAANGDDTEKNTMVQELERHVRLFPSHRDALLLYWPHLKKRTVPLPDRAQLIQANFGLFAPAAFLLNREEHFLSPSGGGIVLVTRWVRLNTPTAVEELGELELPADAVVVEVQTRKADGSVYPPSATPQKSSFSLRNLEPGDIVEFSYLRPNPAIPGMPGRTWGQRFFFSHRVFPTVLAQWFLHAPPGIEPIILTEGELPPISKTQNEQGSHFELSLWMREPLPTEARMTRFTAQSVRAHAGFRDGDVHALLAEEIPTAELDSLEMRRLARRLCPRPARTCIPRTARWVQENIRPESTGARPGHILQRRAGFRPHLLHALLRHEGFAPRIALARPERLSVTENAAWPDPQDYPVVLVHVPDFGFIDTRFSHLPPGHVVPALSGSEVLVLSGKRETARLDAARPQERAMEILVRLQTDHSASISLHETSRGFFAVQKIEQMQGLSREALQERIQTESLQKTFPGARVEDVRWRRITPDGDDIDLQVRFSAPSVTVSTRSGMEMRRLPFPWNLSRRYQVFSPRKTDFLPDALPRTRIEIVIEPPPGFRLEDAPELEIAARFGKLRREMRLEGKNARIILEKSLNTAIVPVAEWKEFAEFCRSADEIETMPVTLVPLLPGP